MDHGQVLRAARLRAGLTQAELAGLSGTSQATISAYERGDKVPSAETLDRVLAAAGTRLTARAPSPPVHVPARDSLEWRGRVLAEVLELAERLPARPAPELRSPPRLPIPPGSAR